MPLQAGDGIRYLAGYCHNCQWLRVAIVTSRPEQPLQADCLDCGGALGSDQLRDARPQSTTAAAQTLLLYLASQPATADEQLLGLLRQPTAIRFAPVHTQGLRLQLLRWRRHWRELRGWSLLEIWWGAILPMLVFGFAAASQFAQGRAQGALYTWPLFVAGYPLSMLLVWRIWKKLRADAWLRSVHHAWAREHGQALTYEQLAAAFESCRFDPAFAYRIARLPFDPNRDEYDTIGPVTIDPPNRAELAWNIETSLRILRQCPPAEPNPTSPAATPIAESPAHLDTVNIADPAATTLPMQTASANAPPPAAPQAATAPTSHRVAAAITPAQDLWDYERATRHWRSARAATPAPSALRRGLLQLRAGLALGLTILLLVLIWHNLRRDLELYVANTLDQPVNLYVDGRLKSVMPPLWVEHMYLREAGLHTIELRTADDQTVWKRAVDLAPGSYALNPSHQTSQFVWHEYQTPDHHTATPLQSDLSRSLFKLPASPDWGPNEILEDATPPPPTGGGRFTWLELRSKSDMPMIEDRPPRADPQRPEYDTDEFGDLHF